MSLRNAGIIAAGFVFTVVVLVAAAAAGMESMFAQAATASDLAPSAQAVSAIPAPYLTAYQAAAATCPGLPWTVLAGIGQVESNQGRNAVTSSAGAVGVVQMLPTTYNEYAQPVPPGGATPPSPLDPVDEIYAAARDLCANGARGGADIPAAIYAYNHENSYVAEVLSYAAAYGQAPAQTVAAGTAGGIALDWALAQVGTPYIWGGETPGVGFDCSGLVQAAYKVAGISLPRVAQAQYDNGPPVPPGAPLQPGDLVFFGTSVANVSHVGVVISPGTMVDAPHSGADVRVEPFPTTLGAPWGAEVYLGATRPGA